MQEEGLLENKVDSPRFDEKLLHLKIKKDSIHDDDKKKNFFFENNFNKMQLSELAESQKHFHEEVIKTPEITKKIDIYSPKQDKEDNFEILLITETKSINEDVDIDADPANDNNNNDADVDIDADFDVNGDVDVNGDDINGDDVNGDDANGDVDIDGDSADGGEDGDEKSEHSCISDHAIMDNNSKIVKNTNAMNNTATNINNALVKANSVKSSNNNGLAKSNSVKNNNNNNGLAKSNSISSNNNNSNINAMNNTKKDKYIQQDDKDILINSLEEIQIEINKNDNNEKNQQEQQQNTNHKLDEENEHQQEQKQLYENEIIDVDGNSPGKIDTYNKYDNDDNRILRKRFTPGFFKKQKQHRTGIPTLLQKKRMTLDIYNPEKLEKFGEQSQNFDIEIRTSFHSKMNAPLMMELEKIEKQKALKNRMEKFIFLFNKDFEEGIRFLIDSQMVEESVENIAHTLLVTEGLNKEMIGKCLGSHKEKNIQILEAYCQLMDFRGVEFDKALRLLLSTFKLPGEAQQIERIVKVFATVYQKDNPEDFPDPDTLFILAYSLLMLNTDAHSSLIAQKAKMTKQQFVDNNMRVCEKVSREYLEKMYDNIVKEKFETPGDYIETIYNRLQLGNQDLQGASLKNAVELVGEIVKGNYFMKYGRKGQPHKRFVWISEQEDRIFWKNVEKQSEKPRSILFNDVIKLFFPKKQNKIYLIDQSNVKQIEDVMVGCNTTQVMKRNKVPIEFDSLCFSIISTSRTLDLKASDIQTRSKWEHYFRLVIMHRKSSQSVSLQMQQKKRKAEIEKLSEIWKIDILPNWEYHWDYQARKPKNISNMQKTNSGMKTKPKASSSSSSSSWLRWFCASRKDKKSKVKAKNKLNRSHDIILENASSDEEYREMCKNKSLLLVSAWKRGIPDWLRKTVWPISIGNRLEITQNLYEILLFQAKNFVQESPCSSKIIFDSLLLMRKDLENAFPHLEIFNDTSKQQSLHNILEAFLYYRPDVGYVQGMSHLAAILLQFCPEYEAFSCFVNLTHSHHFLSFFRGDMREIEWRLKFFDNYFKKELPNLFNHFKALDLSSEMFMLDWFLSLFSMAFNDLDLISRLWDYFLLDGEVFALKASLGILKYFEVELKIQTFESAVKFLKKLPRNIDEDLFFDMIERIYVPWTEYQNSLEAQKVAQINTQIHQAMLV